MQRTLPTFSECDEAVNKSRCSALQRFIYNNEPAGSVDEQFRADLLAALEEWRETETTGTGTKAA